jgi:hypothetical protein
MNRRTLLGALLGAPLALWLGLRVPRVRTQIRNGWILRADDL